MVFSLSTDETDETDETDKSLISVVFYQTGGGFATQDIAVVTNQ